MKKILMITLALMVLPTSYIFADAKRTTPYDVVAPLLTNDPASGDRVAGQIYYNLTTGTFNGVDNTGNFITLGLGAGSGTPVASTTSQRIEKAAGTCSSSSGFGDTSDPSWTIGNISAGACLITVNGFTNFPNCVISRNGSPISSEWVMGSAPTSFSQVEISCKTSAGADCASFNFSLICMGQR